MTDNLWTKGSWETNGVPEGMEFEVMADDIYVAGCYFEVEPFSGVPPYSEARANAHLIASAPEIYDALFEILGPLNVCSDNPNVRDDICLPIEMTMGELRKARAALTKARGEKA